jgi:hypothetical protein
MGADMGQAILMGLFVTFMIGAVWIAICAELSFRAHMRMLSAMRPGHPDCGRLLALIGRVDFTDQIWARVFFRDWKKLYDPELIVLYYFGS